MTASLILRHLMYTGPGAEPTKIDFSSNLNVIFGASNTGKSFIVKTIDFMLGGSTPLPDIRERAGYDQVWLGVEGTDGVGFTLVRAIAGGNFERADGLVSELPDDRASLRKLAARSGSKRTESISQFLLRQLGLAGKRVATDQYGKTQSLSFRDIAPYCIVDETTIMSETSPVEGGQHSDVPLERSVFKLLLTGVDDSAITQVLDKKTFKTTTSAKIEVLDEMITSIDDELSTDYPDVEDLAGQVRRLDVSLQEVQAELDVAQISIQALLSNKRTLASEIFEREQRFADVEATLSRFAQLDTIYLSDIERLGALEEAGFLLSLDSDKDCPLCGATSGAQRRDHGLREIERVRDAAMAEIEKIRRQRVDLEHTVRQLQSEKTALNNEIPQARARLDEVERELARLTPQETKVRQRLADLISARDKAKHGLTLVDQKQSLVARREEIAALRPASKSERPRLGVDGTVLHDFAQVVSRVLKAWRFPGECHVAFDDATYDLRIDGKLRRANGKGVRAVTHAAFKVALLMFCRERNLPHPGFIVLDTPLLPYRDPLTSREGELSGDERAIAETPLKQYFFEHLSALKEIGQFVILENIDPPKSIDRIADVTIFSGNRRRDRFGLFPAKPTA